MPRASRYDSDEERLPHGMTRVGYDADTQVYTFQDADGSYWESAPGCQYGQLTRVGDASAGDSDDNDMEPFLSTDDSFQQQQQQQSWRSDMMPFLNFGVLIGLFLLLLFWFMNRNTAPTDTQQVVSCPGRSVTVQAGDTCWALAQNEGTTVDEILEQNPGLDCSKLLVGSTICLLD